MATAMGGVALAALALRKADEAVLTVVVAVDPVVQAVPAARPQTTSSNHGFLRDG